MTFSGHKSIIECKEKLIAFNKPFQVLSQFSDPEGRKTLADFLSAPSYRAAGRLDYDSEGLLLLTADGQLQARITQPKHKLVKTYLVQVEGLPTPKQLKQLQTGIQLKDGPAKVVDVQLLAKKPGWLWSRKPPIRERKNIPTSWLEIKLDEGRNRQVRRMTAHVGLPTLRLVRIAIGHFRVENLKPGEWLCLSQRALFKQ